MQRSNTGQTITWKLYSQASWYSLICSCSNAYIHVSRTLQFLTYTGFLSKSVNKQMQKSLRVTLSLSDWPRDHRLFETTIQKSPFSNYMWRVTTVWMSQQLVSILKHPAFLFFLLSFPAKDTMPFWLGKQMTLIYWIIMFKPHCARHIYKIQLDY